MSEAEIGAAIRDFLINTGLVDTHEVEMERKPSESSAGRVDLRTRDLIIEFKVRIGNQITPDSDHVRQLDDYLKEAVAGGEPQRFGILTDGKYWILRWPGMGPVSTQSPNAFTLTTPDHGLQLFEWLRDQSQALEPRGISPTEDEVRKRLGAGPRFEQHLDGLRRLYEARQHDPTVQVKRELWRRLLGGRFFQESTGLRRPLKHSSYPRSAAGISLRPAPASTLLTRLRQHIGLAKRIEIPALRAGMTEVVDYASASAGTTRPNGSPAPTWTLAPRDVLEGAVRQRPHVGSVRVSRQSQVRYSSGKR